MGKSTRITISMAILQFAFCMFTRPGSWTQAGHCKVVLSTNIAEWKPQWCDLMMVDVG
jgi:hypothetical protein